MQENRYERQDNLFGNEGVFNSILSKSSILICGAGGLGCPAALYLCAAGIGKLGIIDRDTVSMSNLNRQILYTPEDIGRQKACLAKDVLTKFNPDTEVIAYQTEVTEKLLEGLLGEYDLVLDCTDNFETRMVISRAAKIAKKPLVIAGVRNAEGFVLLSKDQAAPCIGCLYDKPFIAVNNPQVLGAAAGVIGALAAAQALTLLAGAENENNMMIIDTNGFTASTINLRKKPQCKICGKL